MKRPKPLTPVVWATALLPTQQPYFPPESTLEVLEAMQSVALGSTLVNPLSRTASALRPKLPIVPRPLVRFTDCVVPAIVTGAPGQFEPPVDPVTRSTCTVLVNVVSFAPLRIATASRLKLVPTSLV